MLQDYCSRSDKLGTVIQYVNTSSNIVNAVVNSKLTLCNECGIIIHCNIYGNIEKVSDIDLSILLSNLLDNAIEACQKMKVNPKLILKYPTVKDI